MPEPEPTPTPAPEKACGVTIWAAAIVSVLAALPGTIGSIVAAVKSHDSVVVGEQNKEKIGQVREQQEVNTTTLDATHKAVVNTAVKVGAKPNGG